MSAGGASVPEADVHRAKNLKTHTRAPANDFKSGLSK